MTTEIAVREGGSIAATVREFGAHMEPNGLTLLKDEVTPEKLEGLFLFLGRSHELIRWAIGDAIFQGDAIFGEAVWQYQEILGLSTESKRQYERVAGAIQLRRRRSELTWSHHRAVYAMEPADQDAWLQRAVDERWTKAELEDAIKQARGVVEKPRRPYVMEQVCDAAEHVWDAVPLDEGEIPDWLRPPLQELKDALGVEE